MIQTKSAALGGHSGLAPARFEYAGAFALCRSTVET
jgi:hypothetical protein